MISDERSRYKSWSNLKKQMYDLLCDSLKDKVSYFYTCYHEVHNAYGRATINYNKKERMAFSWDIGYAKWDDEYAVLIETNVNIQRLGSLHALWDEQKRVQEELNKNKWMPEGKLCETDFINAITTYLKTDIATSLCSDNYLLRVFAYMDRRVGKRTLVKIKDEVEKLPEWVKQFYRIRCEEDGIVFPPKRIADESVVLLSKGETHHNMKLRSSPFGMIKSGKKTIELRLFDEKRQKIKEGDIITFTNTSSGELLKAAVKKLHRFDSFGELYQALPLLQCGYTMEDVDTAHPSDMEQYYSAEEQQKYGVVGIELFPPEQA